MNAQEAYKIGYMMRCAGRGMQPTQIQDHLHKQASVVGTAIGKTVDVGKWLGTKGLLAALLGPPVAGMAGGYALSQFEHPDYGVEEVRHEEQMRAYRDAISELARHKRQVPVA